MTGDEGSERAEGNPESARYDHRILILAPVSNDARLTAQFLEKAGFAALICDDLNSLGERMREGSGALLVAEEAAVQEGLEKLLSMLKGQPSWSDLPLILITASGQAARFLPRHLATIGAAANLTIIERPVRPETLVSTCDVALRSRRRQYEVRDLLRQMEELLTRMRFSEEALRETDRRKDEFLAMLAHELRNPLAAVSNAMALLDSPLPEHRYWAQQVVQRQTRQLSHLIEDLLDVSRISTGKIHLRKVVVDVAATLDGALDAVQPLLREKRHEVTRGYSRGQHWIEADATRLEQIILNLLTNAAKYTPPGGRIEVTANASNGEVHITVRDNGIGIGRDLAPRIFELFAQGERSIARSEGGLGVGLTIAQRLVEMHGGKIEACSDGPSLGSAFTVRMPAAAPQCRDEAKPVPPGNGRRSRILVVDDNRDTAQGMGKLLMQDGHEVALAYDGLEALDTACRFHPQFVLLDIGLPGMDGFEVASKMRRDPRCAEAVIIALTGYGQPGDEQRALEAGCDKHLVKPIEFSELRAFLGASTAR